MAFLHGINVGSDLNVFWMWSRQPATEVEVFFFSLYLKFIVNCSSYFKQIRNSLGTNGNDWNVCVSLYEWSLLGICETAVEADDYSCDYMLD